MGFNFNVYYVTVLISQVLLLAMVASAIPAPQLAVQPIAGDLPLQKSTVDLGASGEDDPTFVYLGSMDGKALFAENKLKRTWKGAKAICEVSGLKLASMNNQAQVDFLIQALNPNGTSFARYWTSGHESQTASMLVWDGTNEHPEQSYATRWYWPSEYETFKYCLNLDFNREITSTPHDHAGHTKGFHC